jgi:pSer/pThr/pTyr-binding forkhead associated (FHA) protein
VAHLVLVRQPVDYALGTVFPLIASRTYIGRDPRVPPSGGAVLVLPHFAASRKHAVICRTKDGFTIDDLKSRSSTFVNSCRCGFGLPRLLVDGDRIKICDFGFVFRAGDPDSGAEDA